MIENSTPILVGCGDVTDLTSPVEAGRSPVDLLAQAARLAIDDTGTRNMIEVIDTVATLRLFSDAAPRFATRLGRSTNPPKSIARRLGIHASRYIYTSSGGNMPQYLVNLFAESIARGETRAALITGGEALRTQHGLERSELGVPWNEDPGGEPETIGDFRKPFSEDEERHGMRLAIAIYPMIENAIRAARGHSIEAHLTSMGNLFARFAEVAANNPLAVRREGYSAEQLTTISADNRWICFPYPRLMNSHVFIDQAAALVMTSVGQAREFGIDESKWVYLHGCADGNDHFHVSDRVDLHRSPAIRWGCQKALAMAGKSLADVDFFDLYSCFPAVVEITCQELGLGEDDPRGLTVTGGLPFFGGPGNAYVTHSISEMMRRVRAKSGSYGLVTANGNYVTKHSFGVYSTTPVEGSWQRESPSVLQADLDAVPTSPLVKAATGRATIETYTITHGRNGPETAIVLGRLLPGGERFIADTPPDIAVLDDLQNHEGLGRTGVASHEHGRNLFVPDPI